MDLREDDQKFVATQSSHEVATTHAVAQSAAHLLQHSITCGVSVGIVDRFEAVHVDEQERRADVAAPRARQQHFREFVYERPGGQTRERVVLRYLPDALFHVFASRHIQVRSHEAYRVSMLVPDGRHAGGNPPVRAVAMTQPEFLLELASLRVGFL